MKFDGRDIDVDVEELATLVLFEVLDDEELLEIEVGGGLAKDPVETGFVYDNTFSMPSESQYLIY